MPLLLSSYVNLFNNNLAAKTLWCFGYAAPRASLVLLGLRCDDTASLSRRIATAQIKQMKVSMTPWVPTAQTGFDFFFFWVIRKTDGYFAKLTFSACTASCDGAEGRCQVLVWLCSHLTHRHQKCFGIWKRKHGVNNSSQTWWDETMTSAGSHL